MIDSLYLKNRAGQVEFDVANDDGVFTHRSKFKWAGVGEPRLTASKALKPDWQEEVVERYDPPRPFFSGEAGSGK